MKVAIVDTETSGTGSSDEIIELAVVMVDYNSGDPQIVWAHSALHDQGKKSCNEALAIHGISDQEREGKAIPNALLNELQNASLVIAHNAAFDRSMIGRTVAWSYELPWRCSVRQIKWRRENVSFVSLTSLLDRYEIYRPKSHRALDDALGLAKLLTKRDHAGQTLMSQLMRSGNLVD
ncbi:MAG: hypothetical protein CMJ28_00670 [Phycisphaerae bacterium]|nr:hypothetical protein [Phycisphaerae bacterium]